ncbi:MAG: hypothetical protein JXB06_02565 [Spirochaetales bacterium]|nr:hypothetical protein [Spirochaetales bacterium]
MKKIPLLDLLCSREPHSSRNEQYARILCGEIYLDGQRASDPRQPVDPEAAVEYRPRRRFVSRGGEKLAGVLGGWNIDVRGMSFIDAGASSGGFTDCLLQHGASRVIAVEAGRNQLDYRLRTDDRVTVLEGTSIMAVRDLPFVPEAAVADLSLRSLRKAAAHILTLVSRRWLIALVKPQYERDAGTSARLEGSVVPHAALPSILENLMQDLQKEGTFVSRISESHPRGREGNREFFCLLSSDPDRRCEDLHRMIVLAVKQGR